MLMRNCGVKECSQQVDAQVCVFDNLLLYTGFMSHANNNNNMGGKIPRLSALRGFVFFFFFFILSAPLSEHWHVSRTVHYYQSWEREMGRYA